MSSEEEQTEPTPTLCDLLEQLPAVLPTPFEPSVAEGVVSWLRLYCSATFRPCFASLLQLTALLVFEGLCDLVEIELCWSPAWHMMQLGVHMPTRGLALRLDPHTINQVRDQVRRWTTRPVRKAADLGHSCFDGLPPMWLWTPTALPVPSLGD